MWPPLFEITASTRERNDRQLFTIKSSDKSVHASLMAVLRDSVFGCISVILPVYNSIHREDFLIGEHPDCGTIALEEPKDFLAPLQPLFLHGLGVLTKDLNPKSLLMAVLTVFRSTSSSIANFFIGVVGSCLILDFRASRNSGVLFLLLPPLPSFLWMPFPLLIAFLTLYTVFRDTPTTVLTFLGLKCARSKSAVLCRLCS